MVQRAGNKIAGTVRRSILAGRVKSHFISLAPIKFLQTKELENQQKILQNGHAFKKDTNGIGVNGNSTSHNGVNEVLPQDSSSAEPLPKSEKPERRIGFRGMEDEHFLILV